MNKKCETCSACACETHHDMILKLQIGNPYEHTEKEDTLKPTHTMNAILDALAAQKQRGETSLIVRIDPGLIQDAMNALRSYRKLFAPVIPDVTDTEPIYEVYEQMRQEDATRHTILLFVECRTIEEFREALGRLPIRKSSEWRSLAATESA